MANQHHRQRSVLLLDTVLSRDFPGITLYDHQRQGIISRLAVGWEKGEFSTLLAGDVGTGKTLFYLVFLRCVREWYKLSGREEASYPHLAIVPAQIKLQWRTEALQFSNLSPLQYIVVEGNQQERATQIAVMPKVIPNVELIIINYALARRRVEQQLLQEADILGMVVDETHRIKNAGAQQTRATKSIPAQFCVLGSGTAMTKSPADLWSILHMMHPGAEFFRNAYVAFPKPTDGCQWEPGYKGRRVYYEGQPRGCMDCTRYAHCDGHTLHDKGSPVRYRRASPIWGSYDRFVNQYCQKETIWTGRGYVTKIIGARNLPELRRRIRPYMVRWRKSEVLDLPDMYFRHVILPFKEDGTQGRTYGLLKAGLMQQLQSDGYWAPTQVRSRLAQLTYLRRSLSLSSRAFYQAIQARNASDGETPPWVRQALSEHGRDNAKLEWLVKFLKDEVFTGQGQALVYSNWTTVTREILDRLKSEGLLSRIGYATGEMTKQHNEDVKNSFNRGDIDVVIGSPAISEGINLQGEGRQAAYCIIFDCSWTPKDLIQTIGRLYRAKQASDVEAIFLGIEETLDQWMLGRVKERQGWIQEVLDGQSEGGAVKLFEVNTARQLMDAL